METRFCPRRQISTQSWQLLSYYKFYKNGFLPFEGGINDQPAHIMQAIALIDQRMDQNAKQRKKRQKRAKKT